MTLSRISLASGLTIPDPITRLMSFCEHEYAYYDSAPRGHVNHVEPVDVLATVALNSQVNTATKVRTVHLGVSANCDPLLAAIPVDADLRLFEPLSDVVGLLVSAMRTKYVLLATACKVLHRKRPGLIPVLDAWVVRHYLRHLGQHNVLTRSWSSRSAAAEAARLSLPAMRKDLIAAEADLEDLRKALLGAGYDLTLVRSRHSRLGRGGAVRLLPQVALALTARGLSKDAGVAQWQQNSLGVPLLSRLYATYEPRIRALPRTRALVDEDVVSPRFRLEGFDRLEIYYAPMDWLRPKARLAIVGITPGKDTMRIAHQTVVRGLAAGRSRARVLDDVKSQASFSGFRSQLIKWLDELDIPRLIGLENAAALWRSGRHLLQPTSAIRYPVFKAGKNYSGRNPDLVRHPSLRRYLSDILAPELARIPEALVIPLGDKVAEALRVLGSEGVIDPARCLLGFPHPSGQNGHRMRKWDENRVRLKRQARVWFDAHPVVAST